MTLDELMKENQHLLGKPVKDSVDTQWGKFYGVSSDEDDLYYVIQKEDGKIVLLTAITGISEDTSKGVRFSLDTGYYD